MKRLFLGVYHFYCKLITWYLIKANNVIVGKNLKTNGIPIIDISLGGKMLIGSNFKMNNGAYYNRIGRQQQCFFIVGKHGRLTIGDNVGLSGTAIICEREVIIEDYVKIGGNVVIYDTDFHALDYEKRVNKDLDKEYANKQPVIIKQNAFIGAHTTILKGVTIGEGAIVGAGSVVVKSIPAGEIWGGNPAKALKINKCKLSM